MLENAYIKVKGKEFTPIYVSQEKYSFYINFDKPISDPDFDNFRLNLMLNDTIVSPNLGTLKKDIQFSDLYNIHCEFIFPYVPNGKYHFAIMDITTEEVKCKSNCILVENDEYSKNSALFYFRHSRPLYNFNYNNIPEFYNIFRLPLNKVDFQYDLDKTQYRNVTDRKLRNLHSYLDKYVKIESYYFDEPAHDAMAVAFEHDETLINGTQYVPKDAYSVETYVISETSKGTVNAFEQERMFLPAVVEYNLYILSPDGINILTDGNNNLILV